jgi:hypothetical protein
MTKFPLPLILPATAKMQVTQPFGATTLTMEPAGPNGEPHFHYGVDLVWGSDAACFGVPLVLPAAATESSYLMPPGVQGESTPFINFNFKGASGNEYIMTLAHCSEIDLSLQYGAGQIVARTGNYGLVGGTPSVADPFISSHLHLGLQVNGKWENPLDYFDITKWTVGPMRDPSYCTPRINWALQQVEAELQALATQAK